MSRAKGSPMNQIWDSLTREQMIDVLEDLKEHIKQWRQITSPRMQRVDGSELRDPLIGNCHPTRECIRTGHNEAEWLKNLTPAIRKAMLRELWDQHNGCTADQTMLRSWVIQVDERVAELMASFPRGGPYVLTHANLTAEKIFISNDNPEKKFKVSAILGWRRAGFFPWWVEHFRGRLPPSAMEMLGDDTDYDCPGYESADLDKIGRVVEELRHKWKDGGGHLRNKHGLNEANRWYRKPFCACKPYVQHDRDSTLGWPEDHMDVFDIESSDSEDERKGRMIEETGWERALDKHDRNFMRWFKEI